MNYTSFFTVILLFFISLATAQEKKDSLYYKIETFSDKNKVTRFLYQLVFREEADSLSVESRTTEHAQMTYDGRFIRNIDIETIDPFGSKISDKNKNPKWYNRFAEHLHIDSKKSTIANYLLFKKGEKYNAQKLYESERILRSMPFINRVNIDVIENTSTRDSVDVLVKVMDSWSLKPQLSYSGSTIGVGITEENLLGLGHKIDFLYRNDSKEKQNYLYGSYTAYNLYQTFVNAQISGEKDFSNNEKIRLSVARDFISPLTRWAGSFTFEYFMRNVALPLENTTVFPTAQIKVYYQDLWGGYQFPIFIDSDGKITRNIAIMGRFKNYQYKDNPRIDYYNFFRSSLSFLASATFIERKFSVQKNIFQYNLPEDIPYGKSFGFTAGVLNQSNKAIPYAGISASFGSFINWGYFTVKTQFGRFFNEEKNRDTFRLDGTYFTNLQDWKFAHVRHFFSPTFVWGNWQNNYSYKDRINISSNDEFPAYSGDFIGTKKLILRYQMQLFVDKTWKNFHFSPYITTAFGWLSQDTEKMFRSKTHSKFGLGVLINNPYLVFNTIHVSFMFYPKIPFDNTSVFDFNGYRNDMMPLNSFTTHIPHFVNFGN